MKVKRYSNGDQILIFTENDEISATIDHAIYDNIKHDWLYHVTDEHSKQGVVYQNDLKHHICDFDDWHPDF